VARPDTMINADMSTGEVELIPSQITILSKAKELPFQIVDNPSTSEEQRMKYRYLDLRRKPVLDNMKFRSRMMHWTRNWFVEQ